MKIRGRDVCFYQSVALMHQLIVDQPPVELKEEEAELNSEVEFNS